MGVETNVLHSSGSRRPGGGGPAHVPLPSGHLASGQQRDQWRELHSGKPYSPERLAEISHSDIKHFLTLCSFFWICRWSLWTRLWLTVLMAHWFQWFLVGITSPWHSPTGTIMWREPCTTDFMRWTDRYLPLLWTLWNYRIGLYSLNFSIEATINPKNGNSAIIVPNSLLFFKFNPNFFYFHETQ